MSLKRVRFLSIMEVRVMDKFIDTIKKIEDKVEVMDVKGQGCTDDCADWHGNSAAQPYGCNVDFSCKITCLA